jgi:hypothetical protein
LNDIAVGERKISGTGAGRIGNAVTVVGNVIFRFPYRRMAEVLELPHSAREEYASLMERYLSSLETEGLPGVDVREAQETLIEAYADRLDLSPRPGELGPAEHAAIADWDARLTDGKWLAGRSGPAVASRSSHWSRLRQVKINADVWLIVAEAEDLRLQATVIGRRFDSATIESTTLNGEGTAMAEALTGVAVDGDEIHGCLAPFGRGGRRIADLLGSRLTLQ